MQADSTPSMYNALSSGSYGWLGKSATMAAAFVTSAIGLRIFVQNANQIHAKYSALSLENGYDWPQYSDFNVAAVVTLIYFVYELLVWPITCMPLVPFYEMCDSLVAHKKPPYIPYVADPVIPKLDETPQKRIGLVVEPTPFTHVSGYQNRFKELLKYLAKAKDTVQIVTTDVVEERPTSAYNYPIYYTQGERFAPYPEIILSTDLQDRMIYRVMNLFRPDVIQVTSPSIFGFMTIFIAKWLKIPVLISYHTHLPVYAKQYIGFVPYVEELSWYILRMAHNRADLTICTSPQIKEQMDANGINQVDVWRKGVDTDKFNRKFKSAEMRNELTDGNPDDTLLIYVGRLCATKLLPQLKETLEALPNVRLAFVGRGPSEDSLKKHFEGTKTKFMGVMHGERLSQAFASADLFVMPSDSETLGFVVIESMASGVPVVGANAGGIPSIIKDGKTGLLVNPRDPAEFTAKVKSLLDDRQKLAEFAEAAYQDTQNWGWESATSYLRNVQYPRAIKNFNIKKEERIEQMVLIAARFCYFVFSTCWALRISIGQPWLPKALGGLGEESFFANRYSDNQDLRNYLLTVVGFHTAVMLKAFFDGTFLKVSTPLVLASLFACCYILNIMQIAVTIALIHDSTDILFSINSFVALTRFKSCLPFVSGASFIAWAYARLYVLTIGVLLPILTERKPFLEEKNAISKVCIIVMIVYLVFKSIKGSFVMIKNAMDCKWADEDEYEKDFKSEASKQPANSS